MIVIPAIDLKEGKCVRLLQGKMKEVTVFSENPAEVAKRWEEMGAEFLHLVDLDGAVQGKPINREMINKIINSVKIPIQLGGGIRSLKTVDGYLRMGIERIILGTIAYRKPDLVKDICHKYPGKIAVGIDARDGMVAIEGWKELTRERASELAKKFEGYGVGAIIFTDIKRDGMMTGPNIESVKQLAKSVNIPIIASGGVSKIDDIRNLLEIESYGVKGVITGRAIYDGSINLRDAISLVKLARGNEK